MSTLKIGAPNWIEANWATLTALTGSFGTTLDNLKDPDFGNPAIGAATAIEIGIDLGLLVTVMGSTPTSNAIFIPRSNLTQAATWRVKAGSAPFTAGGGGGGTVAYDSTAVSAKTQNPYPSTVTMFGAVSPTTYQAQIDSSYSNPCLLQFTAATRYWYISISDSTNPDGFISLARLFLGPTFSPTYNMDFGVQIEAYGNRQADTSISNTDFIDPTPVPRRMVTFNVTDIPEDEATAYFLRLSMYLSYSKQALFLFSPLDTYHMPLRSFMATQFKLGIISYHNPNTGDYAAQFLEV